MSATASRAQVAAYLAEQLDGNRTEVVRAVAAWLVQSGRRREVPYLVRDVAQVLAERGYVQARVTTARPLTAKAREAVVRFITRGTDARQLELETAEDRSVLGGARIETPGAELDSTMERKLGRFVEGVSR